MYRVMGYGSCGVKGSPVMGHCRDQMSSLLVVDERVQQSERRQEVTRWKSLLNTATVAAHDDGKSCWKRLRWLHTHMTMVWRQSDETDGRMDGQLAGDVQQQSAASVNEDVEREDQCRLFL